MSVKNDSPEVKFTKCHFVKSRKSASRLIVRVDRTLANALLAYGYDPISATAVPPIHRTCYRRNQEDLRRLPIQG